MNKHSQQIANSPVGIQLRSLTMNKDDRGYLTEIFREEWGTGIKPLQWNVVFSNAGVLRGVHVHVKHVDYVTVLQGRASVGLSDLRRGSPTEGLGTIVEMRGDSLAALTIPPGVAHGFYSHEPTIVAYAVSEYWDVADELACNWADPALGIPWPTKTALVSPRDTQAPSLSELLAQLERWQPI
ncbi:dTDP-4-dehydrorhamnose 3,5-epimerase family protein [Candidatus Acetothermia bacterium]|nr:dTDP-4-dehydrorhamnose 3,5-epimerase family protein [Candidatus Acetothermia bacterium]MBI3660085.1 dTDP-4-dehydrorhamnose 3,5-epimerase family protein [Candidatus Acetothermia bacterium]